MPKAQKKRRGGRPRNVTASREPNGRASRAGRPADVDRGYGDVIKTRMRIFGMSEDDARDDRSGTVVGRLAISKEISKDQYNMAISYAHDRHAWIRAIGAKDFKEPRPDTSGTGTYEDFCQRAVDKWNEIQTALDELCVGARTPAPRAALDVFIHRDIFMAELLGDLRIALNHLNRRLVEGRRAA